MDLMPRRGILSIVALAAVACSSRGALLNQGTDRGMVQEMSDAAAPDATVADAAVTDAAATDSSVTDAAAAEPDAAPSTDASADASIGAAHLPLVPVADVNLPGNATRFDYQDIDEARGHLIIAHMNDGEVLIVNLVDGSVAKRLPNIPVARGVVVASEAQRIFVTSSPDQLVIIDAQSLSEVGRVGTGSAPDGVGWDPVHQIVGVSDQGDGAISLISHAGNGARTQVPLGVETGNVVFDVPRGVFWISVVKATPPDQLVAVDPVAARVTTALALPGCSGAHGLRIHPDGTSALVACEGNDMLARVDLDGTHAVVTAPTGAGPDVLSIDPGLMLVYVAAESGDLVAFDLQQAGLVDVDREHPGDNAHSVAVDPATHRVFFPLVSGANGTPILRIMKPAGV
jgi:DNA-binding beta-propeller fold protein YncE